MTMILLSFFKTLLISKLLMISITTRMLVFCMILFLFCDFKMAFMALLIAI